MTQQIFINVKVSINTREADPISWDKYIIPKLTVNRYDFNINYPLDGSEKQNIGLNLLLYQNNLELKYAACKWLKEHCKECEYIVPSNIKILSVGQEECYIQYKTFVEYINYLIDNPESCKFIITIIDNIKEYIIISTGDTGLSRTLADFKVIDGEIIDVGTNISLGFFNEINLDGFEKLAR